jgi:hypothetical protein
MCHMCDAKYRMARQIHTLTIIAILGMIGAVTAVGLPKPPMVYTETGTCTTLSCTFRILPDRIPKGYHVYITSTANTPHTISVDTSGSPLSTNSYSYVSVPRLLSNHYSMYH